MKTYVLYITKIVPIFLNKIKIVGKYKPLQKHVVSTEYIQIQMCKYTYRNNKVKYTLAINI